MSNLTVKSVGYCVVRQALNIDNDLPDHLVTGVFGLFESFGAAHNFMMDVADGPLRKMEHGFTDGEHYWNINSVRIPDQKHFIKYHKKAQKHAVMLSEGRMNRYLSEEFFDKVQSGDDIKSFPPKYLAIEPHYVEDESLAKSALMRAKLLLNSSTKLKFTSINIS